MTATIKCNQHPIAGLSLMAMHMYGTSTGSGMPQVSPGLIPTHWGRNDDISNHWPFGDAEVILQVHFSNSFYEVISWALPVKFDLGKCHRTLVMITQCGSDNGSVPPGNKPLSEPVLTQI